MMPAVPDEALATADEAADEAADLLRDLLLRSDRESIAGLRDELAAMHRELHDRDQLAALLMPVLNRALARSARDTEAQLVAALHPIFFPLFRRAVRAWFEHQVERFRSALG